MKKKSESSVNNSFGFIGLRVDPELKKELEKMASEMKISLTQVVTRMLSGEAWSEKQKDVFRVVVREVIRGELGPTRRHI